MKTVTNLLLLPFTFLLFTACGDDDVNTVEELPENGFTVSGQFFPCDALVKTTAGDGDASFIFAGGDYEIDFANQEIRGESFDGLILDFNIGANNDIQPGTYSHDVQLASANTFFSQVVTNFNTDTEIGNEYSSAGNASSGSVEFSKQGDIHTFEFSFKDEDGITITGYYNGNVDFTY